MPWLYMWTLTRTSNQIYYGLLTNVHSPRTITANEPPWSPLQIFDRTRSSSRPQKCACGGKLFKCGYRQWHSDVAWTRWNPRCFCIGNWLAALVRSPKPVIVPCSAGNGRTVFTGTYNKLFFNLNFQINNKSFRTNAIGLIVWLNATGLSKTIKPMLWSRFCGLYSGWRIVSAPS